MFDGPQKIVNEVIAARMLGISECRLRALARDGALPYIELGDGLYRFQLGDLSAFVASHRHPAAQPMLIPGVPMM